jgi:hypothetical protein
MDHTAYGQPFDFFAGVVLFVLQCVGWLILFPFEHFWIFLIVLVLYVLAARAFETWQEAKEEAKEEAEAAVRLAQQAPAVDPDAAAAARQRRLDEITDFTDAVIAVDQNNVLNAHDRLIQLGQAYSDGRQRLEEAGELPPAVELEYRLFAEHAVKAITGLTVDFGTSLGHLIRTYDGKSSPTNRKRLGDSA